MCEALLYLAAHPSTQRFTLVELLSMARKHKMDTLVIGLSNIVETYGRGIGYCLPIEAIKRIETVNR